MPPAQAPAAIKKVISFEPPCFIVAKGLAVPQYLRREAERRGIPVFRTPMDTTPFIHRLTAFLEYKLAPRDQPARHPD